MLLTSLHSIYYLFGVDRLVGAGVFCGVLVSLERPVITITYLEHSLIFKQSPLTGELRGWSSDYHEAANVVEKAWLDLGAPKRLGVEADNPAVSPLVHNEVMGRLTKHGANIIEATDLVTRMRVVKSPAEARCMRRAAEVLDLHFEAAFNAMQPGARECEIAGKAVMASYVAGGDHVIHPPLITSGVNTLFQTFHAPSRRRPQRGEVIVLEAGAAFQRYNVVACHTVIYGAEPTKEQQRHYAAARAQVDRTLAKLKPGIRPAKLLTAEENGEGATMIYSTGIGFQDVWYEGWPLHENDGGMSEWILEVGTFLSVFGYSQIDDEFMMLCVDPVVITETGYEMLTRLDRSKLRRVA